MITVLWYHVIFMHFGSCHFKLINEQKKELYKNVFCHPFSAFITFCRTHKTGIFVAATLQSIRSPSSHRSFNKSPCLRFFMMYSFTVYNIICPVSKTIEHVHNSFYFNFIFLAGLIFIVTS